MLCLLSAATLVAAKETTTRWQFNVDSLGAFSGTTIIANAFGPTTLYVLSDSKNTFTLRAREKASQHSISFKNEGATRSCAGLVSLDVSDEGIGTIEGEVACGKIYRPNQNDNLKIVGSFQIKGK